MKSNLPQHPCANKCTNFRDGQCESCLVVYEPVEFLPGDVVVYQNHVDCADLQEIEAFQPAEFYWLVGGQIVHWTDIRTASVAELDAEMRLGKSGVEA